jgi:hypothetical protein
MAAGDDLIVEVEVISPIFDDGGFRVQRDDGRRVLAHYSPMYRGSVHIGERVFIKIFPNDPVFGAVIPPPGGDADSVREPRRPAPVAPRFDLTLEISALTSTSGLPQPSAVDRVVEGGGSRYPT